VSRGLGDVYKRQAEGRLTTQYDSILEVDHIKELETNPELAFDPDNLRTLCKDCHNKRHDRMNYRGQPKKRKWDDEWW
jgi:5-methylcytosine-specific restriction endonuclease McrA